METTKVIYTSDLHGNERQYKALVDYALDIKPSVIILGGDLPPKEGEEEGYIEMQREFLSQRLPEFVKKIKDGSPDTQVYVIPGNDDCSVNDEVLDEHPGLYTNIDRKRVKMPRGLEIVGYSNVPITPFGLKDREKFDLTDVPEDVSKEYEARQKQTYNPNGLKSDSSDGLRFREFSFREADRNDSIQRDLEDRLFTDNPEKTVYVFHTPMNNSALDIIQGGMHVGSFAVRQFIEEHQPHLTLHGHIHETFKVSGAYKGRIGNSWGMSAGNHNGDNELAVLVFNIENPGDAQRVKLSCV